MHTIINGISQLLNGALDQNVGERIFSTPKRFRTIILGVLLINLALSMTPIIFVGLDKDLVGSILSLLPLVISLLIIGLSLPSVLRAKQVIQLTENGILIDSQRFSYDQMTGFKHSWLNYSLTINTHQGLVTITKYVKGFEHLFGVLLDHMPVTGIEVGVKTSVSQNYRTTVALMGLSFTIMSIPMVAIYYEDAPANGVLAFIIALGVTIIGSLLLPLEFYRRYTFWDDHFVQHTLFSNQKIPYTAMNELQLNKGQSILHYYYKGVGKRLFPPIGASIFEIHYFLNRKINNLLEDQQVV